MNEELMAFTQLEKIGDISNSYGGMTLRDYFAAKALQGELACQSDDSTWTDFGILARRCYDIADSMLKAREQTNENNHN